MGAGGKKKLKWEQKAKGIKQKAIVANDNKGYNYPYYSFATIAFCFMPLAFRFFV
jgi:hypothetical protein